MSDALTIVLVILWCLAFAGYLVAAVALIRRR